MYFVVTRDGTIDEIDFGGNSSNEKYSSKS